MTNGIILHALDWIIMSKEEIIDQNEDKDFIENMKFIFSSHTHPNSTNQKN